MTQIDNQEAELRGMVKLGRVMGGSKSVSEMFSRLEAAGINANEFVEKTPSGRSVLAKQLYLAKAWFEAGCPRLRLQPRTAAALAVSEPECAEYASPWPIFAVDIDESVVGTHEIIIFGKIPPNPADASRSPLIGGMPMDAHRSGLRHMWSVGPIDRLIQEHHLSDDSIAERSPGARKTLLLMRIAMNAGLLASVYRPSREQVSTSGVNRRQRRAQLPGTNDYVVGKDVTIDLRDRCREFCAGTRTSIGDVQFLVRGHWRNQPCGKALSERRMTWIEPYWKGGEFAPVLVRSHVL